MCEPPTIDLSSHKIPLRFELFNIIPLVLSHSVIDSDVCTDPMTLQYIIYPINIVLITVKI